MRVWIAAVLMITVSAWGQTVIHCDRSKPFPKCPQGQNCRCDYSKPKPSVKKIYRVTDLMEPHTGLYADPCDGWACTKPVEEFHWSCLGDCFGVPEGTTWERIPFNAPDPYPDHILQTDVLSQPDKAAGDCFRGNMDHEKQIPCPDKAAVPVEPKMPNYEEWEADKRGLENCLNGKGTCEYINISATALASVVGGTDGSKMVKLSDSEYSHLEQLRASVVEEERRLAVKYGAFLRDAKCAAAPVCISMWDDDHYEYKGQFLLIDKGGKL